MKNTPSDENTGPQSRHSLPYKWLLLFLVASPLLGKAQFSYLGGGLSAQFTLYNVGDLNKTKSFSTDLEAGGIYQPLRFLGLGARVTVPLYQVTSFTFRGAKTTTGVPFKGFDSGYDSEINERYLPDSYDYTIKRSVAATFLARFYLEQDVRIYVDLRYSLMSLTEKFEFKREKRRPVYHNGILRGGVISERNIDEEIKHISNVPGIGLGIQRRLSDRMYMDAAAVLDIVLVGSAKFVQAIAYDWKSATNAHEYVTIESQASGTHPSLSLHIGIGYIF